MPEKKTNTKVQKQKKLRANKPNKDNTFSKIRGRKQYNYEHKSKGSKNGETKHRYLVWY